MARPTKFTRKKLKESIKYYEECKAGRDGKSIMPFIEELALRLDVDDDTIVEWAKIFGEFSATIKKIKMLQKLLLQKLVISVRGNTTGAIFLLKANHGLKETTVVEEIGKDTKIDKLATIINDLRDYARSDSEVQDKEAS